MNQADNGQGFQWWLGWILRIGNFMFLAFLCGIIIFALLRGGPDHADIVSEVAGHRAQLTYISCLLETPSQDRTPAEVAACQVGTTEGN